MDELLDLGPLTRREKSVATVGLLHYYWAVQKTAGRSPVVDVSEQLDALRGLLARLMQCPPDQVPDA